MSVRLAFGVMTGPGMRCWLATPGGTPLPADDRADAHPPGAPAVVGPADAAPGAVRDAVGRLSLLVAGGSEVAAGAGVDLGRGFTSARLAGAAGDRRDAVLAVLRFLGAHGSHRLGDRAAILVALFGLSATKRVGAAAHTAMVEERWAALQLASAVSDLLGPEQLEQVLALTAPDGTDPFPHGAASTLSGHLALVLARYPRPRRLALVVSLWEHVCARLLDRRRMVELAASQTRADRVDRLRERHREHFDEPLLRQLRWSVGDEPSLAATARWQPPPTWTADELGRLLKDAIAATALLRFARTMSAEGVAAAAREHHDELAAACLTKAERAAATRRSEGAYSHPARPGRYVHDLLQTLRPDRTVTARTETYVRERVALARNYGVVVFDAVTELLDRDGDAPLRQCWDGCEPWQAPKLREWRAAAGFRRAPAGWEQPPMADAHADGPKETLAQRVAANPAADPAELEAPHDLLWYADLADALAPFHGNETATVRHLPTTVDVDYDLPAPPPEPGTPRADSLPLAAAGVAQLVAFGATPPPRCGSWEALVEGVRSDAAVAEAGVGTFPVPAEVRTVDGQTVPGTGLVVELGRDPRQLAGWSSYMGNCIGESWYADQAHRGECVLMALRADGRVVANLDIRHRAGGWQVHELRARFNDTLPPELEEPVRRWVKALAPPMTAAPQPAAPEPPPVRPRTSRRTTPRLPAALIRTLAAEVEQALTATASARRTYAQLASTRGNLTPAAAATALKRLPHPEQVALLREALREGLSATTLWRATKARPLTTAVDRLPPADRDRLIPLTEDAPLPRTLRALVRRPEIAPAHAMEVVARAIRKAMGTLLTDEALTRSIARRPTPDLLCAVVVATTCADLKDGTTPLTLPGATEVPGFPATDLSDEAGPWRQALPAARELDARAATFPEQGLRAPTTLLGKTGWPALWHRAHR